MRRTALTVASLCAALLLVPRAGLAQYFGQNKVQYERFEFQVLRTPSFDIYHYPEEADAVREAARIVEGWRLQIADRLGFPLPGRQTLILYASHPHFRQTQAIGGLIDESTGGVTESAKRRMVLPFTGSLSETSHVLGHELVHAFQYSTGENRVAVLPLWFIEGMAEYLTVGPADPHTAMWLRDLARAERLPGFEDLDRPQYFPYRIGHAAWAFLAARFGDRVVGEALLEAGRRGNALAGIEAATGRPIDELSEAWRSALRERYGEPTGDAAPGRALAAGEANEPGRLNVSPALSPDGRWIAYLSERGLFSIDLYLAETATGRVRRRLTTTDTDPHTESLQFVGSAGAWDASSRRLAFTTVTSGRASLSVTDVEGRDQRFDLDVDEAWHPSWSPDGRQIVFAGLSGGRSDLYVLTLESGTVRQLTSDAFADLQPAWSPDGRRIAFMTDRFTAARTSPGDAEMRLGILTVDGGHIAPLPAFASGKHINPQWTADGSALYLVADPDGVANAYRLDLATQQFTKVTDVTTGVTGITAMSPALSYAPAANALAFSVFREGGYDIRLLEPPADLGRVDAADARPPAPLFAPAEGRRLTAIAPLPLPEAPGVVEPYRPRLSLDAAGASGGIGTSSRYGAFFGGGVGMQFSDILGDHTVGLFVAANGGVRDIGGQAAYINRTRRWNWGAMAMLQPYVTGGVGQSLDVDPTGRPLLRERIVEFRQTDADVRGLLAYPFSRAFRAEVQSGVRHIWFDQRQYSRTFDYVTGALLDERRTDLGAPGALTLGDAAAALVYDQSAFGPTSPIRGQRFRFEAAPTFGSLRFTGVTLDYRRYMTPVRPVTLAVRGLHIGRYGGDGEDPRLSALFLGYPSLVRGYDSGSFDARDCGGVDNTCPAFEQLLGSRLLVGNAELRFPLAGVFRGDYDYGPLPIEGFVFGDVGVAWTADTRPSFADGDRRAVRSLGVGARVNAFGFAVVEFALARPLDRTGRGWVFSFNMLPGF